MAKVIHEFREVELSDEKSSTIVTYRKRAIAIAQIEAKKFIKISHHVERRK